MPHKPIVTIVPDHSTLLRLSAEADVRRRDFMTSFRAKFPVGADVLWQHPEGRQFGKVLAWSVDLETLLVQNDETAAEYWISPSAVIEALSGEGGA